MQRRTLITAAAFAPVVLQGLPAQAQEKTAYEPEIKPIRIYGNDAYPVPHRRALPLDAVRARVPSAFHPGRITTLKKGTVRTTGALPLPCDIVFEQDVPLTMRDGTRIYTDVFRPVGGGRHPAIVAWSPYGKEVGGQRLDDIEKRAGIPKNVLSELEKFEGADPAFWVAQGYVVLNPDPRGAGHSQGNISYWGRQLAEDGYDFIEWAAKQPWCSGKIGMAGNSWLTVSQWFIAAEQPPHLAAIAPWEGFCDHYEEPGTRGGIPEPGFPEVIIKTFAGEHWIEDQPRMIATHLTKDEYWRGMAADLTRIHIPAYVVASYTNAVHTHGSFAGFMGIASKDKWLRVNNTNEWFDFYTPRYRAELLAFFDRFLKGKANGFEQTPRVRYCILDAGGKTEEVEKPAQNWPLPGTTYQRLHLGAQGTLLTSAPGEETQASYNSQSGSLTFTYAVPRDMDLVGYMRARLWVQAPDADDMDLEVLVEKVSAQGEKLTRPIPEYISPAAIANGRLRVSMRELDPRRTTAIEPFYTYTHPQKLRPGEIVPVDIAIWPMGEHYRAGEKLQLTIHGVKIVPTTFEMGFGKAPVEIPQQGFTYDPKHPVPMETLGGNVPVPADIQAATVPTPVSVNHGRHVIHFGGRHDSWLQIAIAP